MAGKRRLTDTLAALTRPKVALMMALGFSSGLPFMLIGNTLGFWLAEDHIKLATIGFLSWIGLTYSVKFIWGAVVDRLNAPLLTFLGRRRGWMIVTQLGVGAGLVGMSLADPRAHLGLLTLFGLVTGISAASQDTVIDAWRIESAADPEELGLLTSAYSLGFRAALIGTEALILILADKVGWPLAYATFGGLMAVGLVATLLVEEPVAADQVMEAKAGQARRHPLRGVSDAVIGPLITFFRGHGWAVALLMLGLITTYHLSDYMRGPMTNPYYQAMAIPKLTIAGVRATLGLAGSIAGIALGGISCLRLGVKRTLILGAIVQPVSVASFALLGLHGGDFTLVQFGGWGVSYYAAVMTFDALAMAYSGVALTVYMSTLTSLGYTATQYALLTSALTWSGKTLKGFSGVIVDQLHQGLTLLDAYGFFYLLCAAIGLPGIILSLTLPKARASEPLTANASELGQTLDLGHAKS